VVDFMMKMKMLCGTTTRNKIIKRYDFSVTKGRMAYSLKDLGITDNLTGGLLQVDKVIKK
jgi:hypothetical protein